MAKMQERNIAVSRYEGTNLRIEAILNMSPIEDIEDIYRVNGPKGIKMMILPKDMSDAAVQREYVRRYGTVEIEEELE